MRRASRFLSVALISVPTFLAGCAEPAGKMEGGGPPPRPAELDRLDMLVGTWEGTAEMSVPGVDEPTTSKIVTTTKWELDKRFLVDHFEGDMGEEGKFEGVGVWTWDPKAKEYRNWWFDSLGSFSHGTTKYDEETRTLHMRWEGTNSMTGKPSYGDGTSKFIDDNTQQWTYKEWDNFLHWGEPTIMSGTYQRK